MIASPHRIRRQRWLVRSPTQHAALAIRHHTRNLLVPALQPVLEQAFDELAPGESILRIPKLQIRLHIDCQFKNTEAVSAMVLAQLREQLLPLVKKTPVPTGNAKSPVSCSLGQSRFEILIHFLQTGTIPWPAATLSSAEIALELKAASEQLPELIDFLKGHPSAPPFYFRLLQLLSHAQASSLVHELATEFSARRRSFVLPVLVTLLAHGHGISDRHAQLRIAAALLAMTLSDNPAQHLAWLSAELGVTPDRLPSLIQSVAPELSIELLSECLHPSSAPSAPQPEHLAHTGNERHPETQVAPRNQLLLPPVAPVSRTSRELFPLTVSCAGLVLLHPFLVRFLEHTGVKDKEVPVLPVEKLARAAALLHLLAMGEGEVREYDLGFTKILLGLHPGTPVCVSEDLILPADVTEAEILLQSAIDHWRVLKNTSVAGLRTSFLQRKGLLRHESDGWRLHIERQTFDMLLDHLPWGISVIKLPWMPQPIYTEW